MKIKKKKKDMENLWKEIQKTYVETSLSLEAFYKHLAFIVTLSILSGKCDWLPSLFSGVLLGK